MRLRHFVHAAAAASIAFAAAAAADSAPGTNRLAEIQARFRPNRPTVAFTYDVNYRFMGLELLQVATARITTTEGRWHHAVTRKWVPACVMEFAFDSMDEAGSEDRRRLSFHNRILSVLTMPQLDTILYLKQTDEVVNPLFKSPKKALSSEMYSLESGRMDYCFEDYLTGLVRTNMTGTSDMERQGKEVSSIIKLMSTMYYGHRESFGEQRPFQIHVNVDGAVVPFDVKARSETAPLRLLGNGFPSLRVDVVPAQGVDIKARSFAMWAASFADVAKQWGEPSLLELSGNAPAWSMVPLVADYGISLGSIRCSMRGITNYVGTLTM